MDFCPVPKSPTFGNMKSVYIFGRINRADHEVSFRVIGARAAARGAVLSVVHRCSGPSHQGKQFPPSDVVVLKPVVRPTFMPLALRHLPLDLTLDLGRGWHRPKHHTSPA